MMIRRDGATPDGAVGPSRRRFAQFAGAGLAVMLGRSLCRGAEARNESPRVLKRGDKIDIRGQGEAIVQRAYELGYKYEKQHGG